MNYEQLKNSILQEAIEGRLVPQDPSDEPAAVLLQRIREEKARLVKEKKIKKDKNESIIYRNADGHWMERFEDKKRGEVCIDDEIPFEIPESWEWCRWGSIAVSIQYGYNAPAKESGVIKMVRISDIQNNRITWETVPYCDINEKDIDTYLLAKDDILFARTGGTVGKSYLVKEAPERAIYAGYLIRTRYFAEYLEPFYLKSFMESSLYWQQLKEGTIATAQPNCNGKTLSKMLIPLPPLSEQHRIVARIEEIMPKVEEYGKAQERLDALNAKLPKDLKNSILQEAIEGRLVPQNPSDEPAAVLLRRIREEKARLVKEKKIKKDKNESIIYRNADGHWMERFEDKKRGEVCIDDEIPFEIPETWEWCRMRTIGDWGAGATPQRGNPLYYEGGTIPWIKTGELNNSVVYDSEEKVTKKALEKCSLRMCKKGDVLIAMYGATIGKLAIAGNELTTNQACCACTPMNGIFNYYLFYFLMASKDSFTKLGAGGAQPNISRDKLINYLFPLPPLSEQHRIVSKLESLLPKVERLG